MFTIPHTFKLPSRSLQLCALTNENYQQQLLTARQPFYILGEGSNSIFISDYAGTVYLNQLTGITIDEYADYYQVRVASGENWHVLVTDLLLQGIGGLENLALIPGTVGAAPVQNIGAYGVEVADLIAEVEYLDLSSGQLVTLNNKQCQFAYRSSIFKTDLADQAFITQVVFHLAKDYRLVTQYGELANLTKPSARKIYQKVMQIRQRKLPDPSIIGNAGSFFKNPLISVDQWRDLQTRYPAMPAYQVSTEVMKIPAGWLIDHLGLKGMAIGGAQVHPEHALVLTNAQQASGEDVLNLATYIKQAVSDEFHISLEHEVRLVGREGLITL